jgi:uncharacterized membrane protein
MSGSEPAEAPKRRGGRWLLFGSLALNLFFIGIAVAFAVRSPPPRWERNVVVRIERIAEVLPEPDAAILRQAINAERNAIETAQQEYRDARDRIRDTLRRQPFSEQDMRAAMAATRAARQSYDVVLHGMFADAAAKMSPEGRLALADWRNRRKSR